MRIALFGYGAMGKLVEVRARSGGHDVPLRISRRDHLADEGEIAGRIADAGADVAIDFSSADAVPGNVRACVDAKIPIVVGTTGWQDRLEEITGVVERSRGAMLYGANFAIGVNLFYRLVAQAARALSSAGVYEPFIEEQHHSRKKDAPSGTALKLAEVIRAAGARAVTGIACTRAGHITGTHRVGFDGPVDQVLLIHTARSREGFADGALFAATWIIGRTGVFEFDAAIDDLLAGKPHRSEP